MTGIIILLSFNNGSLDDYIGNYDISAEKQQKLSALLAAAECDDYDRLIQLCDAIATADGIVAIEERMNGVKRRYGFYPQRKWDKNIELKRYFEDKMNCCIYDAAGTDIAEN